MRIVGGNNRGRRLRVTKKGIRPTKGLVREAIFNIISKRVESARVLDVFAGSGALGIEALSRGAAECTFIEIEPRSLTENIAMCSLTKKAKIINSDFRNGLKSIKGNIFDIIMLDPPYHKGYAEKAIDIIIRQKLLHEDGMIIAEHSLEQTIALPRQLALSKMRKYGATAVSFIVVASDNANHD
jgi:16S rRNA (guanine966-N2)-methyltransferase